MINTNQIVFSGSEGSIGSCRPQDSLVVKSFLESDIKDKISELIELKSNGQEPKAFIHLAAQVSVKFCEENPSEAFKLNTDGAVDWFKACQELGMEKFIFASTSHVYSPEAAIEPLNTDADVGPQRVYGKSKLAAERALKEQERSGNTKLIIARVFSVLADPGPEWSLMEGLKRRARNKDFSPIPGLSCERDFLTNHEVCEKLVQIAQSQNDLPPLINVCSGKATSIRSIAEKVFEEHGLDTSNLEELPGSGGTNKIVGIPTLILPE